MLGLPSYHVSTKNQKSKNSPALFDASSKFAPNCRGPAYYDLKLEYEDIKSDNVRRLLKLENGQGVIVANCDESGQGFAAGFRKGDVVLSVGEESIGNQYDFVISVNELRGQKDAIATVFRNRAEMELEFKIDPIQERPAHRWIIGVSVEETSELLQTHLGVQGVSVTGVNSGSPAEKMNLLVHDIILKINQQKVQTLDDLRLAVQPSKGKTVSMDLLRKGNRMTLELTPMKVEERVEREVDAVASYRWSCLAPDKRIADPVAKYEQVTEMMTKLSKQVQQLQQQIEQLKQDTKTR